MKRVKYVFSGFIAIFMAFSYINACETKGGLNKISTFSLKRNECHQFAIKTEPADFLMITARQNGVDIELRLFENGREIKATDSENLNSGFEFLPFIVNPDSVYVLQVRWVDDRRTILKNEGVYTLEVENRVSTEQDRSFIENFEKAKSIYDKATIERLNGNGSGAVNLYQSAIDIYRILPQNKSVKYKLFLTNYYLGVTYNLSKKYADAADVLEQTMASASENQDGYLENLVLKELGAAYLKSGNYLKSEGVLENAVNGLERLAAEMIGEKQSLPSAYIVQAETFLKLNKIENAIANLENVRANFRETVNENALASLKLADIYLDLGDSLKAGESLPPLPISDSSPNYIKGIFNKVSGKLYMKRDKEKALDFFNRAQVLLAGNSGEEAELLMFIGNTHYYAKDYGAAKTFYEQAKTIFESGNNLTNLSQVLNNLGVIYYTQRNYALAISNCESALSINTEIQNELNQARNLINLMYFHESSGDDTSAILYGKWAINIIQSIKYARLQNLEQEIRDNFRDSFTDAFRKLANLLIKDGRIAEAEQVLRFIKEKEYQDYVRGESRLNAIAYTKSEENLLGVVKNKIEKKPSPLPEMSGNSLTISSINSPTISPTNSPTKRLIEELKAQNVDVSEILFVTTLVTPKEVNIIATNEWMQKVFTHKLPRENLSKLVFNFREAVTDVGKNPKIEGKKLYDILVKPLEKDFLSSKIKKIVWSLDGVLRYISIPALFDGEKYLVQRFANIQLTLASEDKILLPKTVKNPAIGFASSKPFENLSSLPVAKNELDCIFEDEKKLIINSTCKKGIIKGKKMADEDFTKEAFEDALKKYKLIHLTSHFVLQAGDNSKSFLLLGGGNDRRYTMEKFAKQPLDTAEILIMSACDTANFSADGAEFESFATMAQKQGARTVIGTLWSVADVSTSKFMTEFYRLFQIEKLDKANALRQAQINLSTNKNYSHPFYWSPFVLFGNWK